MTKTIKHSPKGVVSSKTTHGFSEAAKGGRPTAPLPDVTLEDVLGRNPARLEHDQISAKITGKVVLVSEGKG